jgi:hypothetical protein
MAAEEMAPPPISAEKVNRGVGGRGGACGVLLLVAVGYLNGSANENNLLGFSEKNNDTNITLKLNNNKIK